MMREIIMKMLGREPEPRLADTKQIERDEKDAQETKTRKELLEREINSTLMRLQK